ncbi:MAG: hypothetical protein IOB85_15255 [Methylobacterium sp.]|nr:hypothetical protein [Methylobacterium sp.]MCA3668617.1 hypothetical protein [Methylobacterium sp.]MCA3673186.1 hypothetical protein [Methylobacterium sp.]MCA3675530.1 hypothetical protein [Methylobacterium sp.]MCA3682289.1 hypothetical protein [Methylobacterium sp.]
MRPLYWLRCWTYMRSGKGFIVQISQGRVSQEDTEFILNIAGMWKANFIAERGNDPTKPFSAIYSKFKHVFISPVIDDMQRNSPTIDGKIVLCYFLAAIMISQTHSYERLFAEIYAMAEF